MNFEEFLNEKNMLVVIHGDDKLINSGQSHTAIGKDIEDMINDQLKKYKQSFKVQLDYGWEGAGYSFDLDFEDILKKLNK